MNSHHTNEAIHQLITDNLASSLDEIGVNKTFSAIQAIIWRDGKMLHSSASGTTHFGENAYITTPNTPFDIASITKSLVGATLFMRAIDQKLIRWDSDIATWYPELRHNRITLLNLLNHTSGLSAWHDYYSYRTPYPSVSQAQQNRAEIVADIVQNQWQNAPGRKHCYSDLGYILLADILEKLFDRPLEDIASEEIFTPLNMHQTDFISLRRGDKPLFSAAATEFCPYRKNTVIGTVHDDNTHIMGGVSCHAGVFSTANDLLKFAKHLLETDQQSGFATSLVSPATLRFAWSSNASGTKTASHVAGWDRPSGTQSSAGNRLKPYSTVGHLGFTGTSLWIDREQKIIVILLTNRTYPNRDNSRIKAFRVSFHNLAGDLCL